LGYSTVKSSSAKRIALFQESSGYGDILIYKKEVNAEFTNPMGEFKNFGSV
jgi:hypothetical protein